ncbi:hypothetical protein [Pontiella sulfatireligans]|uniref:Uncharacterized protein n=1 Tax=Pontiella sulfatireligans TaxID=2750658 RepID=A0A6C2USE9_9BACT|nr:hypothetical protein [Pontiella sulfatireligans]VGO22184.1 hypothetical protein SCARR_04266 [Pontiella sulfatireligans]
MNLNVDFSKYVVPVLGACCIGGALLVAAGLRSPVELEAADSADAAEARIPESLALDGYIPTMEEVLAKHLFVPERAATGENAFPDLLVKGVYVGETQRNAVFSLKSKPGANLRVWQGDEQAALSQVEDERDPRQPIVNFLEEWQIKSIDFAGVTLEHIITGEVETYEVDYKPLKHAKDSAQGGYGQGMVVDTSPGTAKPAAARTVATAQSGQQRSPSSGVQGAASRVGAFMQRMSPQQRQQFMQQLQKQNAAASKKSGGSSNGGGTSQKKSSSSKKSGGSSKRRS